MNLATEDRPATKELQSRLREENDEVDETGGQILVKEGLPSKKQKVVT